MRLTILYNVKYNLKTDLKGDISNIFLINKFSNSLLLLVQIRFIVGRTCPDEFKCRNLTTASGNKS